MGGAQSKQTGRTAADSGEVLELTIQDLSRGGAGVAREPGGRVIFVPYTAPGDRVKVRVLSEKKRFAQGELLEVLEPSPERKTPPCPVFGRCGGCQWQHLDYNLQWKTKAQGVAHALKRAGIELIEPPEEFPAEQPWNYRNRIQLRGEAGTLGFFAPKSHDIIALSGCPIARREINESWEELRQGAREKTGPYKLEVEVLPDGTLRTSWNQRHGALGFRQVNDEQNEKLRHWIDQALPDAEELLDLYGGSGNFSRKLAVRMGTVHCVDTGAPESNSDPARTNLIFHRAPVTQWLGRHARNPKKATRVAIVDPPREGLAGDFSRIAEALERLNVSDLIAVGCDPDAWARDVYRFLNPGRGLRPWRLQKAAVLDFFPQTPHVESVAHLTLY